MNSLYDVNPMEILNVILRKERASAVLCVQYLSIDVFTYRTLVAKIDAFFSEKVPLIYTLSK